MYLVSCDSDNKREAAYFYREQKDYIYKKKLAFCMFDLVCGITAPILLLSVDCINTADYAKKKCL